jgi:hypothetical protein
LCRARAASRAAPPQWRLSTLVDARVSARSLPTWCTIDAPIHDIGTIIRLILVRLSAFLVRLFAGI